MALRRCILVLLLLLPGIIWAQKAKKLKRKEKALIEAGNSNDTMRVLVITNSKDSLFLRKQAKDVNFEKDEELIRYFSRRMSYTMTHPSHMGVGIAAPQVGLSRNIICVQRFSKEDTPVEVYINPKIISCSDSTQVGQEGCLSIPNQKGEVKRYSSIEVEYLDLDGKKHIEQVTGFDAVIFQHEIDHLRGILFIDHLKDHQLEPK